MRRVAWAFAVFSVLVACGGSVSSSSDGTSSSGGGGRGDGSGSNESDSKGSCAKTDIKATRACVPGTAAANQDLVLQVDDVQGCLSCFTTVDRCTVAVAGNVITLGLDGTQCTPKKDVGCPAVCAIPSAKCAVPPLAEGKYTVVVSGENDRTGLVPRELVVTAGGSETSCTLTNPASGMMEENGYPKSCSSDDDCRPATFGNRCQPCACPNGAITKLASEQYEAETRAATSQCPGDKHGVVCAACPPVKARCDVQADALAGTCVLEPG